MIDFAEPRVIRPATENDLEPLQKSVPKDDPKRHAEHYAAQKNGDGVYLIAIQGEVPVGHALLRWGGTTEETVKAHVSEPTPDVEDLFVHEKHRNRKVGSRLLEMAEKLAREREFKQIGLSCGAENKEAAALYAERGYRDSGVLPYTLSGKYTDADGKEQKWTKRDCSYLIRPLSGAGEILALETNMENNEINTAAQTPDGGVSQPMAPATTEPSKQSERPVSEQVVDFAFGVALTAAEALERAVTVLGERAKVAQQEAPAVWEALQQKGRPAREKLVQSLRDETREETEAATQGKTETPPPAGDGETPPPPTTVSPDDPGPIALAPVKQTPIKPAPRPFGFGRSSNVSAEDEIKALEDRVRTLEREVVSPPALITAPTVTDNQVNPMEPTPAETGTSLVDFSPETTTSNALTNSPYAITDDEERASVPSNVGEPEQLTDMAQAAMTPAEPESPDAVAALVDGAGSPAPVAATDPEAQPAPAKSKRARKGAGADADDASAMSVEELEA